MAPGYTFRSSLKGLINFLLRGNQDFTLFVLITSIIKCQSHEKYIPPIYLPLEWKGSIYIYIGFISKAQIFDLLNQRSMADKWLSFLCSTEDKYNLHGVNRCVSWLHFRHSHLCYWLLLRCWLSEGCSGGDIIMHLNQTQRAQHPHCCLLHHTVRKLSSRIHLHDWCTTSFMFKNGNAIISMEMFKGNRIRKPVLCKKETR